LPANNANIWYKEDEIMPTSEPTRLGERPMNKFLIVSVAALGLSASVHADSIILNAPNPPGPTFTPLPFGMVEVSDGGFNSPAYYPGPIGSPASDAGLASVSINDFIAGPGVNAAYPGAGTGSFSYMSSNQFIRIHDSDAFQAHLTWNQVHFVDDGTYSVGPVLYGTDVITFSTGDAAFEGDFPLAGTFNIEGHFLTPCGRFPPACAPGQIETTEFLGGSVTPLSPAPTQPIDEPEPLMLLCAALLGLASVYCRRGK
jgi:hypothetical protein